MKVRLLLILILSLLFGSIEAAETKITDSNWIEHPKIREVRAIYIEVEQKISAKKLVEEKKTLKYSEPYVPTLKILYWENRQARKYVEEAGSEDSSLKSSYYYDQKQVLRFAFITGSAVIGSQMEHRIYFNEAGKKIWEIQVYIKGPSYTFPKVWPEDQLVFNPAKAFYQNKE